MGPGALVPPDPGRQRPLNRTRTISNHKPIVFSKEVEYVYENGQPIFEGNGFKPPKGAAAVAKQKNAIRLLLERDGETVRTIGMAFQFLQKDVREPDRPGGWRGWGRVCGSFVSLRQKWEKIRSQMDPGPTPQQLREIEADRAERIRCLAL